MEGFGWVFSKAPREKVDTQMSAAPNSDKMVGSCRHIDARFAHRTFMIGSKITTWNDAQGAFSTLGAM